MSVHEKMTAIADAIREKTGTTDKLGLDAMAERIHAVHEAGQKAEYDRFWDGWQDLGNRTDYKYAFSGKYWNDETFSPKYDIVPKKANSMFEKSEIVNLIGILEECGVTIDFSQCSEMPTLLQDGAKIKHFPTIDLSGTNNFNNGFRYATNLVSASFVNVKPAILWSNSFANCTALVDVSFSGTIGKAISFAQSSKLSDASIQNIIDALADLTGATAQTLTLHATVGGKLTDEQKAAVTAKNWTLVY